MENERFNDHRSFETTMRESFDSKGPINAKFGNDRIVIRMMEDQPPTEVKIVNNKFSHSSFDVTKRRFYNPTKPQMSNKIVREIEPDPAAQ